MTQENLPVPPRQHSPAIKVAANAFAIWRVGKPKGWDVTATEVARQVGIDPSTVRRIAANRGWPLRPGDVGNPAILRRNGVLSGEVSVDVMMSDPHLAMESLGNLLD
jgi:hypothetical protein